MGYFKEVELKRIALTDPKYWVDISSDLQYGDLKKFASISSEGQVDLVTGADTFLQTVIKVWNLDDDEGTVLPITIENINRITKDDALLILNEAGALVETEDQKKSSSSN